MTKTELADRIEHYYRAYREGRITKFELEAFMQALAKLQLQILN